MAGVWDEDLTAPVAPEMPKSGPGKPLGAAVPPVPYSPGMWQEDLNPPLVVAAPPPAKGPDTRPFLTRADETAGDAIRAFTNAVTLGQMDRLAGAGEYAVGRAPSYEEGVNQQVGMSEAAEKRSPTASLVGGVAGGVALPGFGGAALATKLGGGALGRMAGYGVAGGVTGALGGAGNTYTGNPRDYVENALIGGAFSGVLGSALGGALGPRPRVSAAKTPTTGDTYDARDFVYDRLRANRGFYENPYLATEADRLANTKLNTYTPSDIPTSLRAVEQMRASTAIPGGGNTPAEIEAIRASINKIPHGPERAADRAAGREVKRTIDEFYTNPPLGAVRVGTEAEAATAGELADLARRLHGAARRGHTYDNILHDAELASHNPRSGVSYEDAVWSGVRNLEKADRPGAMPKLAGFDDASKAALDRIAYPSWMQRSLRTGSDWLGAGQRGAINPITLAAGGAGTGYGLGSYLGADPTTTAALGAAGPLTGLAMRAGSTRMARKAIQDAYDVIHQSNPLYDARVMTSGTRPGGGLPPTTNDAVRNALAVEMVRRQPQRIYITKDEEQP